MLYSNKKLQKTKRYEEYQTLKDKYYKLSLTKEAGATIVFKIQYDSAKPSHKRDFRYKL